jgi:hypothetical protein
MEGRFERSAGKKPFDLARIGDVATLEIRRRRIVAREIAGDDLFAVAP